VCGDGLKLGAEACDDANTANGDGCSSLCAVEQYWSCTGSAPSVCAGICGDGHKVGAEQCDDGNTANGDCCSSGCLVEAGCEIEPNNTKDQAHASGNVLASGVVYKGQTSPVGDVDFWELVLTQTSNVKLETFDATGPSNCTTIDTQMYLYAADGTTQVAYDDDGGPGACSLLDPAATATVRSLPAGTYYVKVNDYSNNDVISYTLRATITPVICGDGAIVSPNETCDDGNTVSGDGCSATCAQETGWTCTGTPSVCTRNCGNGVIGSGETCDDGNAVGGDGCSATCTVETGYACTGTPSVCALTCGNGVVGTGETCDDGNVVSGDGCSATCAAEPGYTCTGTPSVCTFTCGNGTVTGAEQCDDGNTVSGDGCSATCQVEATAETEANDTCLTANGPYTITAGALGTVLKGGLSSSTDQDWFKFTTTAYADLSFQTFDQTSLSTCVTIDTGVQLCKSDCTTTQSATQDQGGIGSCSKLDTTTQLSAMSHLPPGTYALKVYGYSASTVGPYFLQAKYTALCGNGVVEGSEQCDGGANCGGDCMFLAVCGDGTRQASEQCDDGNLVSGDGCSATCTVEATAETETNNTCATANGPYTIPQGSTGVVLSGSFSSATDQDWFKFTTTTYTDLSFQTSDQVSLGTCASPLRTITQLYKSDCTTVQSTAQDGSGASTCAKLDGTTQPTAMKHLPPGTYVLKLSTSSASTLGNYWLQAKYTAYCGNGVVEGSEECDGGANCAADCTKNVACGNGKLEAGEGCDDGNTTDGDGCSATCAVETGYACVGARPSVCGPICGNASTLAPESCDDGNTSNADGCSNSCQTEATYAEGITLNGTVAQADTAGVVINGASTLISGAITPAGDKDIYKMTLATAGVVRFETFDTSGNDCTSANVANSMKLSVLDSAGAALKTDSSTKGIGNCAALVLYLNAGTYYAQVELVSSTATLAAYKLQVAVQTDRGSESETPGNDTYQQANGLPGSDVYIFGGHQGAGDFDTFAVYVPAGKSIRAEVIEGSTAETCESQGIDSRLRLYGPTGTDLGNVDDIGRGYCSLMDGTGATPTHAYAHNLATGGVYYLRVEASSPTSTTNLNEYFDYRLVVTIR
jgi:cysteine-rich repeat protein